MVFMKYRSILMAAMAALCLFPAGWAGLAHAQHRADPQHLSQPGGSSLILFGDPQGYIKYDLNQPLFDLCMAWVADNIRPLNIQAVLFTGDMVEQNDNNALDRRMLNQSSRQMWEAVSNGIRRIDGKVPYIICGGNHDYGFKHAEDPHTYLPDYFTFERQGDAIKERLVAEYPNREGRASLENSAYELTLPGWDHKLLVITSEFYPSDGALEWAGKLLASDKYKDHYGVYLTHSYMRCSGRCGNALQKQEKYGISQTPGNNSGEQIWEKLVRKSPNLRLVLCGHHGHGLAPDGSDDYLQSIGWRVDRNDAGKEVFQMMFNVQTLGGGWEGNGGDGWLRILEFLPDGKTVKVRTYSPLFGISKLTRHLANRTAPYDQFDFSIEE